MLMLKMMIIIRVVIIITSKAFSLSSTVIFLTSSALVSKSNWKSSEIFENMMMMMEMLLCDNDFDVDDNDGHDGDIVFSANYLPWKGMKQVLSFRSPSPVVELTLPGFDDTMIWQ